MKLRRRKRLSSITWLKKLKKALIEGENYWNRGLGFAAVVRSMAVKYDCVLVDARGALEAKGSNRIGNFYTSHTRLNHRGHELLADLYFGLFSKEETLLFRDRFPKIQPVAKE